MKKLYNNHFNILISSFALASNLIACTPNKINSEQMQEEITTQVVDQTNNIVKMGQNTVQEIKDKNKDKEIEEYISQLKQEISEFGTSAKEKWNSEETQEKIDNIKQKSKDLFDFVVNGKEINGIKFKDLSDNGKEIVKESMDELDEYMELLIPNYKERAYEKIVNGGAKLLEEVDSLKETFEKYKEDVLKEYNSRTK